MKKYNGLDFTAAEKKKSGGFTAALIAAGVLLLGAVSFLILLAKNDFDTAKFFGARLPEDTTGNTLEEATSEKTSTAAPQFSDKNAVNFLFVCHDSSELSFCTVISVSVSENCIKVKAVPADTRTQLNGAETTASEVFRQKGIAGVKELLESKGIKTSKYVLCTETAFKLTVGTLGATVIELPRAIAFSDGAVKYTFAAGKNTFTADLLLKLIKYGSTGDETSFVQALACSAVISRNFTIENFNKGSSFFSSLINPVETDITAFDYSEAAETIKAFILASPSIVPIG